MRRLFSPLNKPVPAWFILVWSAVIFSAIGIAGASPPSVHTIETVKTVERIPGTDRVIVKTVRVCDGKSVLEALNEVQRSQAKSGEAGTQNAAVGRVGPVTVPHTSAGSAHADGDNAAAVAQNGTATSGVANVGQILSQLALCGNATMNAQNTVTDSKAVSGKAVVENRAATAVGTTLPLSSSSPSPSPSPQATEQAESQATEAPEPELTATPQT